MKQITFIQHAIDRLKERGISSEQVKEIVLNPDYTDRLDGRKIAQKLINGKLIRVIYDEEKDVIIIISAYRTSKVGKYLRK